MAVGDIVFKAAGMPIKRNLDLIRIIQHQAPGTWLPLNIRRGDQELLLVAKFPARAETPK